MTNSDTSVCTRLSDELFRLKKTHAFIADACNVSTKTVGRWCKNVPIPADKLEMLAPHGFDVLFIIYGCRFTSLDRFSKKMSEGESLDDLISEFYKDVEIFRSKFTTDANSGKKQTNTKKSITCRNLDQDNQTWISDPTSEPELGSNEKTMSDSKHHEITDHSTGSGRTMEAFARIPLYDVKASAGNGATVNTEDAIDSLAFKNEWIHNELHVNPAHLYLIYVEGESMMPSLHPGDVILVDHSDNTAKRDGIYVLRMDGALLVKRLQRLPDAIIKVSSDNPLYVPFEINLSKIGDTVSIIGRVVWTGRRL